MATSEGEPRGTRSFRRKVAINIAKGVLVAGGIVGTGGAVGAVESEVLDTPKADVPTQVMLDVLFGTATIEAGVAITLLLAGVALVSARGTSDVLAEISYMRNKK